MHRVTPQAIQELFDELEASRQSRRRAWDVLQKIRAVLNEETGTRIAQAAHKTFDAEGELIMTALKGVLSDRNIALRELVRAGRAYKECVDKIDGSRPPEFPNAHLKLLKALDRAGELFEE